MPRPMNPIFILVSSSGCSYQLRFIDVIAFNFRDLFARRSLN
jgi:hypothetical protein